MKCSVLSMHGQLYFHLYKNETTAYLTSLSKLRQSILINVTNYSHTKSENLTQNITLSNLDFNGSTYLLTQSSSAIYTFAPILTNLSEFVIFQDNNFSYLNPSVPLAILVEAPCSVGTSSFSYNIYPALPFWISYSPTDSTST